MYVGSDFSVFCSKLPENTTSKLDAMTYSVKFTNNYVTNWEITFTTCVFRAFALIFVTRTTTTPSAFKATTANCKLRGTIRTVTTGVHFPSGHWGSQPVLNSGRECALCGVKLHFAGAGRK